jgi:3-hydroxyacyl-CoA dehydrogenase
MDMMGLDNVCADVKRFLERRGFFLQPAPLLGKLAREGRRFADLGPPRG